MWRVCATIQLMNPRRLREATRAEHEATEALMPLTDPNLTRDRYRQILGTLYPLIASWELWVRVSVPEDLRSLIGPRERRQLLTADLKYLGVATCNLGRAELDWDSVVINEGPLRSGSAFRAAFLGAFYVIEGSTLGGRFIARHVESVLGLEPGNGDAYFRSHEEKTGAMWREVLAEIEAVPEFLDPVVIGSARRTFTAFGRQLGNQLLSITSNVTQKSS